MHARSGKIACPYLNCNIVIMTSQGRCTDNLLKHKRNYHEDQEVFQVVEPNQLRVNAFVEDQTDDHFDVDFEGDEEMTHDDSATEMDEREMFDCKFWSLWLEAEFCHILAETEITFFVTKLRRLAKLSSNHLKKILQSVMPGNDGVIEKIFDSEDWLTLSFSDATISSAKRRESEAKRRTTILQARQNNTLPVFRTSIKTVVHNIAIEPTILAALESSAWEPNVNNGFPAEMDHVKNLRMYDDTLIASYKDSIRYQEVEASIPPEDRPGIHLQLYSDEFDRDLMGSTSKRHKVHVTYLRILNIVDGLRRSPDDYHLIQILPSQTLQANGYVTTMAPLVQEIATVVENGISYRGRKFGVRLSILQADGLERAAMFGMASNFSKITHCDPLSYLTTKMRIECQTVEEILSEVGNVRDRQSYAEDLAHLSDSQYEGSRGLKFESPFNRIPHYHVTDKGAVAFCLAHDLYSGAFRSDMARVLVKLCELKHFTWKKLQDQFRMYRSKLTGQDRQAWYDIIPIKPSFKQLPGNHSSNHLIIRFLSSFFFKKRFDDAMFQSTAWSLYLSMKQISEVVSCKILNEAVSQKLTHLVQEYLEVNILSKRVSFHLCLNGNVAVLKFF